MPLIVSKYFRILNIAMQKKLLYLCVFLFSTLRN